MSERYSFSLTTFSPSGKLVQIEYALNAVNAGQPAVGIKAKDGVVIATEKKHKSTLQDETSYFKVPTYYEKTIEIIFFSSLRDMVSLEIYPEKFFKQIQ